MGKSCRIIENKLIDGCKRSLYDISKMIVEDNSMLEVLNTAYKVSKVESSVIILGETGVGKEGIAKYIHYSSSRKNHSFITINCGAIPNGLIESELFGYEPGAFTGASKTGKMGLFQLADKGTIFLDEVGELPQEVQVKLLRVLQEQEIEKVGGIKSIKINVRVIAATHRNLQDLISKGLFREDLYYRLCTLPIKIPPLRERKSDIIPLVKYFATVINKKYNLDVNFNKEALECLRGYHWPGNVRELRNIVEMSIVMSEANLIGVLDLPEHIINNSKRDEVEFSVSNLSIKGNSLKDIMEKIEEEIIEDAIQRYGSIRMTAKALGVDSSTLIRKRQKYRG